MNLNKELGSVAEAVKKVMEAELSPKQKAIAKIAEPKHKIDAGDLAKLRAGHKPVKEEKDGASKPQETKFHGKLDKLVHKTFGKSKEEMKNNPEKYDLLLDSLISRLGVLYAYISLNEYINKDSWVFKYLPCICLQSNKKEDVIFLYGDLSKEETTEIITNFLKD